MRDIDGQIAEYQQQLDGGEQVLALHGLGRLIGETQKTIDDAERSLAFNRSYRPSHPGTPPGPGAGGMDYEDYAVAAWEYAHADEEREAETDRLCEEIDEASDKLDWLKDNRKAVRTGDVKLRERYAAQQREYVQAELARLLTQKRNDEHWEQRKRGAEVPGAVELYKTLARLYADEFLQPFKRDVSFSGWQYRGDGTFVRNPGSGPFGNYTERLHLARHNREERFWLDYVSIPRQAEAIDKPGSGRTVPDGCEYYTCTVAPDGVVAQQEHSYGGLLQVPDVIINGNNKYHASNNNLRTNWMPRAYDSDTPRDRIIVAADVEKLNGVAQQVATAMAYLQAAKGSHE